MKKPFGFVKKVFGFGKKNLYIGIAFLVVVGLLSLFIFSGAREGFVEEVSTEQIDGITTAQMVGLTTSQIAGLTTDALRALSTGTLSSGASAKLTAGAGAGGASAAHEAGITPTSPGVPTSKPLPPKSDSTKVGIQDAGVHTSDYRPIK